MGIGVLGQDGSPLKVDAASGAMRSTIYDVNGNSAVGKSGDQPNTIVGIPAFGVNDDMLVPMRVDRFGSQASALHEAMFTDSFEGVASNNNRWTITATAMTAAQTSAGGINMNSGNITTASAGYMIKTARHFAKNQRQPLHTKIRARLDRVANSAMDLGFCDPPSVNAVSAAGAYWQVTPSGVVQPVVTFNSVDQTGVNVSSLLTNSNFYTFDVFLDDDEATFVVQDTSTGLILSKQSITLPSTGPRLWSTTSLPITIRLYNTASAPAVAPHLIVTDVYVAGLDAASNKPFSHLMAAQSRDLMSNPFSGAQLAQWTNSADPASAVLSNTAAGYTTLGGRFQFAMVAGAATDYALFGFQVPAGVNLHITKLDIELWNTGAANAATPSRFEFAVATGSTAVTLVAGTVMRRGLGSIGLPASAAIGVRGDRVIEKSFDTPLFCPSGRFMHIILRCPVPNAATASQIIQGMANIEGYFA